MSRTLRFKYAILAATLIPVIFSCTIVLTVLQTESPQVWKIVFWGAASGIAAALISA